MELRHLRYFTAIVRWKGYREAARQLYVTQPALSRAVSDLEAELGLRLFHRDRRSVHLTSEGEVFYVEALQTLKQAERTVEAARRAAKGEVGQLRIGFLGSATAMFLPELIRLYRAKHPGIKLILEELNPQQQQDAFAKDRLDIGLTRPLADNQAERFDSEVLYQEPLLAALPEGWDFKGSVLELKQLAKKPLILYYRVGAPALFDTITALCSDAGLVPNVEHQPCMMQTALSLVAAEAGVALVPACVRNLRSEGVKFMRIRPDTIRIDLVVVRPKQVQSVMLRSFVDLLRANAYEIRKKVRRHLP